MAVERFSIEQFRKRTAKVGWTAEYDDGAQHIFERQIYNSGNGTTTSIIVHTSIDIWSGVARDTAKDSIRVSVIHRAHGHERAFKIRERAHWVTRTAGWEERLLDLIRFYWGKVKEKGYERCECGGVAVPIPKKKSSKWYRVCLTCDEWKGWC